MLHGSQAYPGGVSCLLANSPGLGVVLLLRVAPGAVQGSCSPDMLSTGCAAAMATVASC